MDSTPVGTGLFVWPAPHGEARLIASRCPECGEVTFPAVQRCRMPSCSLIETESAEISGTGAVVTSTVQRYPPPGPFGRRTPFHPIPIVLVEFPEQGVSVLGQLWDWNGEAVAAGRRTKLVLGTLYPGELGQDVVGWGFTLEDKGEGGAGP